MERYIGDTRVYASTTARDSPLLKSDEPIACVTGKKVVAIQERRPDGVGYSTTYVLDRGNLVRRWDHYGPNDETTREKFKYLWEEKRAAAQGEEALARFHAEAEEAERPKYYPLFAASERVNYLPVGPEEIRAVARLIGEKLGITDRLRHIIEDAR